MVLLNGEGWSVLRTWDDRKTIKIEDRLMDVVISIFEQVDRLRSRRTAEQEAAKRRAEQAERERQVELRRKEEQQRVNALLQNAKEGDVAANSPLPPWYPTNDDATPAGDRERVGVRHVSGLGGASCISI